MPPPRALTRRAVPARGFAVAGLAAGAAAVVALAGCAQVDAALSKQIAVVRFNPGTTAATQLQVRRDCSHVPNLPPLPSSLHPRRPTAKITVRYEASKASAHDLAALQICLQRFPEVTGVALQDIAGRNL